MSVRPPSRLDTSPPHPRKPDRRTARKKVFAARHKGQETGGSVVNLIGGNIRSFSPGQKKGNGGAAHALRGGGRDPAKKKKGRW